MRPNTRCLLPLMLTGRHRCRFLVVAGRFAYRGLCAWGMVLAVSLMLTGLALAADGPAARSTDNLDARWLAWIGSWRLVSDAVNEADKSAKEDYLLEIRPGADGKSIVMKSYLDGKLLLETRISADGSRQALEDSKCSGWYKYSWSETGRRLLFESEAGCPAEVPRFISGISIITDNRDWIDIQLLRSGEDHAISVRKYRIVSDSAASLAKTGPGVIGAPRFLAGTSLSIDEVIELNRKLPPELLEAAIVELQKPFNINSNTLKRLSSAGVPPRVVDLMVALSFPDKFTVSRQRITPIRESGWDSSGVFYGPPYVWLPFGYWSIYGPYSNWYWGTSIYGYWGGGWYGWPGGYPPGHYGGGGDHGGGRLVNGRGYSRVEPSRPYAQPRYAQPRNYSGGSGSYPRSTSSSSTPPSGSGGGSSGSASGGSGGTSPSASPGGYHSGGNGGGQAKRRD